MFSQLKKAICKARRNPRYLWYFFLNVNVVRDHFPSLYREMQRRKALDLGGQSELSWVHVIQGAVDLVINLNTPRRLVDFAEKTRSDEMDYFKLIWMSPHFHLRRYSVTMMDWRRGWLNLFKRMFALRRLMGPQQAIFTEESCLLCMWSSR